jgi:hypothetical protein
MTISFTAISVSVMYQTLLFHLGATIVAAAPLYRGGEDEVG